jgi:Zn-dependent protease with chaperone function
MQWKRSLNAIALAVTMAAVCEARQPGEKLKPGFNLFSKQQDVQLGQEAAQQIRKQFQVVQDQNMQEYLRRVGDRLSNTPEPKQSGFPFNFTLLNQPEVNAFALPGGPMFVFTGLVKAADNEAQLAGVMAHELAHVILRHGTNQASKANLLQLPAMLAGVIGGGSMLGQLAQLGVGLGANSVLLKFSRDAETQADAMGARIMSDAGYNPIEMARFFEKLEAGGGSRGPQFLSDHPDPGNRVKAVEAEIRTFPQSRYGFETGQFAAVRQRLGSLPAPSRQGNLRSSAAPPNEPPSGGWKDLHGQSFNVSYPGNGLVFGDRQSSMMTIAPREGLVQGSEGGTEVGYGAILSYYTPRGRTDLRSATSELVNSLQASNPSIQLASRNQRRVRVSGSDGLVTMLRSSSPFGGAETDALLTVGRPEGLFYMVFVAPERQFPQLQGAFEQMIGSLRFAN